MLLRAMTAASMVLLIGCGDLVSTGPVDDELVVSVELGQAHGCSVTAAGDVTCRTWRGAVRDVPLPVPAATVTAGAEHACALDRGGRVWCWGLNTAGQLGRGSLAPEASEIPEVVVGDLTFERIDAGSWTTCGVTTAGEIWCWGYNGWGMTGHPEDAPPAGCLELACPEPVRFPGERAYTAVTLSEEHGCALATDGTAWCWGSDRTSALGTGEEPCTGGAGDCALPPTLVTGGRTYRSIAAGREFSCALDRDRFAWCWGAGTHGQLGTGAELARSSVPVAVASDERYLAIEAAAAHACAVTAGGGAWCWGGAASFYPHTPDPTRLAPDAVEGFVFEGLDATSDSDRICGIGRVFGAVCWRPGATPEAIERQF